MSCGRYKRNVTDGPCLPGIESLNWRKIKSSYEEITSNSRQKIIRLKDSKCKNSEMRKISLNWENQSNF